MISLLALYIIDLSTFDSGFIIKDLTYLGEKMLLICFLCLILNEGGCMS